ncbi:bifunctional tetrahydrofolate synthase/dihydrofolate synthase [Pseudoalteromonas phenolica]|uniref:Dihydrofolate synthase/folylpolyglutamate synthase n=1 Tax=Pseudoalteromonas phenolica TaxID=161398 RepID=A0A5S3Z0I7_9GAMM|nr:bifunctional tetrahydrofolate synthase/dihydrofolate synthase [Pseudoalteromonas phenolica]TMP83791.1 bifunctional tetrahydrofolate synthase/dihydrofolate synthase [Pseudoalteromonas phenolica]
MSQNIPCQSSSLDDWLCYLERVHPANIEMGLERIKQVADSVNLLNSSSKIIMIAGTNGKGTTARCLESLLLAQGYSVGTYASPHLIRYNERVRVNGKELGDQYHVDAFDLLEKGRCETPLTYFEFGTLGALAIFKRCEVDYVLFEVGLGGRFDATNIVEPIASVITTIDLDHKEYLGDTRELVGYDKAGIFRADKPAIVGDLNIPHTVTEYGDEIAAELILSKRDFFFEPKQSSFVWRYKSNTFEFEKPSIPAQNVATALTLLARLELLPELSVIEKCLADLKVEGRFQKLSNSPIVFTDVAHNPESARYLKQKLVELKQQGFKIHALIAMLADKDKASVINEVSELIDFWSLASLDGPRAERASNLLPLLSQEQQQSANMFDSVHMALDSQLSQLDDQTAMIVFGSFFTVAEAIQYWQK